MSWPRVGTVVLRGAHVLVFALWLWLAAAMSGGEWGAGIALPPAAAAVGMTCLRLVRGGGRGTTALVGLAAALLLPSAAIAAYACHKAILSTLWEVQYGTLGPNGANDACLFLWATLLGAIGAYVLSVLGGWRDAWSAFGWYAWTGLLIAFPAFFCAIGGSDPAFDYDTYSPTFLPPTVLSCALVAFLLLLPLAGVSLLRRAQRPGGPTSA